MDDAGGSYQLPFNFGFGLKSREAQACSNYAAICDSDMAFGTVKTCWKIIKTKTNSEISVQDFPFVVKRLSCFGNTQIPFLFHLCCKPLLLKYRYLFYIRRDICGLIRHISQICSGNIRNIKILEAIDYLTKRRTREIKNLV